MKTCILLRHIALYPLIRRFRLKRDIPDHLRARVLLVDFRLWGRWYVAQGFSGIVMANGSEMPVHIMHANDGKMVIGQHDLEAARGTVYAEAWRESYAAIIEERLQRQTLQGYTT